MGGLAMGQLQQMKNIVSEKRLGVGINESMPSMSSSTNSSRKSVRKLKAVNTTEETLRFSQVAMGSMSEKNSNRISSSKSTQLNSNQK